MNKILKIGISTGVLLALVFAIMLGRAYYRERFLISEELKLTNWDTCGFGKLCFTFDRDIEEWEDLWFSVDVLTDIEDDLFVSKRFMVDTMLTTHSIVLDVNADGRVWAGDSIADEEYRQMVADNIGRFGKNGMFISIRVSNQKNGMYKSQGGYVYSGEMIHLQYERGKRRSDFNRSSI